MDIAELRNKLNNIAAELAEHDVQQEDIAIEEEQVEEEAVEERKSDKEREKEMWKIQRKRDQRETGISQRESSLALRPLLTDVCRHVLTVVWGLL